VADGAGAAAGPLHAVATRSAASAGPRELTP